MKKRVQIYYVIARKQKEAFAAALGRAVGLGTTPYGVLVYDRKRTATRMMYALAGYFHEHPVKLYTVRLTLESV